MAFSDAGILPEQGGIFGQAGIFSPGAGGAFDFLQYSPLIALDADSGVLVDGGGAAGFLDDIPTWENAGTGASNATQPGAATLQPTYLPANGGYLYLPGIVGNDVTFPLANGVYNYVVTYSDATTDTGSLTAAGGIMTIPYNDAKFSGLQVASVNFTGGPNINFAVDGDHGDTQITSDGVLVDINESGNNPATLVRDSALRMDGDVKRMKALFDATQNGGRVFMVGSYFGGDASARLLAATNSGTNSAVANAFTFVYAPPSNFTQYNVNAKASVTQPSGRFILESSVGGGASRLVANGVSDTDTFDTSLIALNEFYFGGTGTLFNAAMDIHWLYVYPASMTDEQADEVTAALNAKFNIY